MNLMPQEIEVWYILPAIRSEIAKMIFEKGLKQKDTAKILGIANSCVCQYLKNKRANEIVFDDNIKKEIKKSCDKLVENWKSQGFNFVENKNSFNKNKICAIKEIQHICSFIKSSGFLCSVHKKFNEVCSQCRQCT